MSKMFPNREKTKTKETYIKLLIVYKYQFINYDKCIILMLDVKRNGIVCENSLYIFIIFLEIKNFSKKQFYTSF
jgi:hypothetical protein